MDYNLKFKKEKEKLYDEYKNKLKEIGINYDKTMSMLL